MATKFLEPGGDADFLVGTTNGFWSTTSGVPAVATDFVHGGHLRSIAFESNGGYGQRVFTAAGTVADAGARISCYFYINTLPNATSEFVKILQSDATQVVAMLRVTTGGVLQLWSGNAQIGSSGSTLSTGVFYRISIAYTIGSTSVNRFEVFKNGVPDISVTNATLTFATSSIVSFGSTGGQPSWRMSDFYIDDSNNLLDTGNIWVVAKRAVSNGTAVEFTTQVGASGSGYGTGHSPQVNERALSVTNGWSISTTTKKTEQYSIESQSVGDIDISTGRVVDYMGWVSAKVDSTSNSPVHNIIVAGVATAITLSTTDTVYKKIANSATYPTGNTDIGIDAQYTTTPHTTTLNECGIIVAYIPYGLSPLAIALPKNY